MTGADAPPVDDRDSDAADGSDARADARADADPTAGLEITLIAAVAANGVIGADGDMPWYYPADLQHFKETTTGHPVIMGRRTYESIVAGIDGPLPDRTNVVLSTRDLDLPEGAVLAESVEAAIRAARDALDGDGPSATDDAGDPEVFVIGGASVYEQFLPLADRLVITEIPDEPAGDTRFPDWDDDVWTEVEREQTDDLAFVTYERR
ncbi:MAG: dihydrofolate reductase [Haloferacaceae archaeon]